MICENIFQNSFTPKLFEMETCFFKSMLGLGHPRSYLVFQSRTWLGVEDINDLEGIQSYLYLVFYKFIELGLYTLAGKICQCFSFLALTVGAWKG